MQQSMQLEFDCDLWISLAHIVVFVCFKSWGFKAHISHKTNPYTNTARRKKENILSFHDMFLPRKIKLVMYTMRYWEMATWFYISLCIAWKYCIQHSSIFSSCNAVNTKDPIQPWQKYRGFYLGSYIIDTIAES